MNGSHTSSKHSLTGPHAAGGVHSHKAAVYGGQTFKKSAFPPAKYIQHLLHAYCPDSSFNPVRTPHQQLA